MMHDQFKAMSGEHTALNCKVLQLPYSGDQVSMVLILPNDKNGLTQLENRLTFAKFQELLSGLRKQDTIIRIPKFKVEESSPDIALNWSCIISTCIWLFGPTMKFFLIVLLASNFRFHIPLKYMALASTMIVFPFIDPFGIMSRILSCVWVDIQTDGTTKKQILSSMFTTGMVHDVHMGYKTLNTKIESRANTGVTLSVAH
jgi:hypothetical protein